MTHTVSAPLVTTLRRLLHPPEPAPACDLCHGALSDPHAHVVDIQGRRLLCACGPCAAAAPDATRREAHSESASVRFKPVPRRLAPLPGRIIADAHWRALEVPVDLAFFFLNSRAGRIVACYPGPAGVTEAWPPPEGWTALAEAHPWVRALCSDVEALLVRRVDGRCDAYRAPIDACYELAGRIRAHWSGMNGGALVRAEIDQFFAAIPQPETAP